MRAIFSLSDGERLCARASPGMAARAAVAAVAWMNWRRSMAGSPLRNPANRGYTRQLDTQVGDAGRKVLCTAPPLRSGRTPAPLRVLQSRPTELQERVGPRSGARARARGNPEAPQAGAIVWSGLLRQR